MKKYGIVAALMALASSVLTTTPLASASASQSRPDARLVATTTPSTARVDSSVVRTLRARGSVDAIVTLRVDALLPGAAGAAGHTLLSRSALDRLRKTFNGAERSTFAHRDVSVLERWDNLPTSFVRLESQEALEALLEDPRVASVSANKVLRAMSDQHLNVIRQPETQRAGHAGDGKVVAVLDSGIDHRLTEFGSCSAAGPDCRVILNLEVAPNDGRLDDSRHGSNVGGIIAKVAPGAKLIGYDIFRSNGLTNAALLQTALNHLIGLKSQGVPVVAANMSLGGDGAFSGADCAGLTSKFAAAFTAARNAGIIPVVAAGNGAKGGSAPRGISWPGCIASALTVGATHDAATGPYVSGSCRDPQTRPDMVTCFSQTGPALDLLAPGSNITAGGVTMSGTSQATPHVAGAVAVLSAASPSATVGQIEAALVSTGPIVTDTRYAIKHAHHRLDVYAAVERLLGGGGGGGGNDTTPPIVSAPQDTIVGPISDTHVDIRISWSGSDRSGIAAYELWARTNGGAWTLQPAVSPTATSWTFALAFDTKYEFAVKARDRAGNVSQYQYSAPITPIATDDTVFSVADGSWKHYQWPNIAFRGTGITTSMAGAWINFTFTGRDVALIAPLHAQGGRAQIYCDGAPKGTVDLLSPTLRPRELVFGCSFAQYGQHTMKLVVEGTPGRPRFDVDGFVALT